MSYQARVHRVEAGSPNDMSGLNRLIDEGKLDPEGVVAVLGKTEGNGCVNDFTRGFATDALKQLFGARLSLSHSEVERRIAMVMSGGTEGGLSPHWIVFEKVSSQGSARKTLGAKRLALGAAATRDLLPEEIGRETHVRLVRDAVLNAVKQAGIGSADDVHYVQVKCPLLTKKRIHDAALRDQDVATDDTYKSMAYSRGASALGVATALGEVGGEVEKLAAAVCVDFNLYSGRASTSAGVELMDNQILVLGNSADWGGDLQIAHRVMQDAIDFEAVQGVLSDLAFDASKQLQGDQRNRFVALLAKAEPSRTGHIRGARHIMLDDSDIQATRHARAVVGGVLAAIAGDTRLFVSGGAEHQGPDGGGPVALIARAPESH